MYKILIVDDDFFNIRIMEDILKKEYKTEAFTSGTQLMTYLAQDTADLILMDYVMPEKDGIEILRDLRRNPRTSAIPVIILTAQRDVALEIECFKNGAEDFITKPFAPDVVLSRISRIIDLNKLREGLQSRLDEKSRQMENVLLHAFTTVANIVDGKDDFTEEHSVHVAQYCARIAQELGWSEKEIYNIYYTGLLHDIGKISVPDKIIRKATPLSDNEWRVLRGHTTIGAEILKDVHIVNMAGAVALYHHERYDGTGYPMGIKGDEIPLEARIVALANAYDSMVSTRSYRNPMSEEQIIAELEKGKGTQFDPWLVDVLVKMIREKRFEQTADLPEFLKVLQPESADEGSRLLFRVLEANNRAVKREAMKDSLTGLYNRNYTEKYVEMSLRKSSRCAYIIIDLDNFKQVNDGYGHIAGDYALKNVANMLKPIAENIGIACRMGGDEFLLFFDKDVDRKSLHKLASGMLEEYAKIKQNNDSIAGTSLSIGVAVFPDDGTTYQELYNAADKALYLAKRGGKNRYCFFSEGVASDAYEQSGVVDLHRIRELIQVGKRKKGSYQVEFNEFQRIYNFILRCMERNRQDSQLILFTVRSHDGSWGVPEALEEEVQSLEMAIVNSLRRNDVSTRYSSSQLLVVLTDSKKEFVDMVIRRILDNYEAIQRNKEYIVMTEKMSLEDQDY